MLSAPHIDVRQGASLAVGHDRHQMLDIVNLSCVRGDRHLFKGVDLSLTSGECVHLEGHNGAGKTSLLRIACGLSVPESGQVLWRGEPIRSSDTFRAELLYLGHQLALKDDFSALENLQLHARITADQALDREQARQALWQMGLRGKESLPVRVLSQGQKRRAALARLLCSTQSLWILDEPLVALDSMAQQVVCKLLGQHLGQGGLVLMTSHQPLALDGVATRSFRLQA